jgi:hypothetical protein
MLMLTAAAVILGSLVGCHSVCSHGICDCEYDDYCASRSPWMRGNVMVAPPGGVAPAERVPAPSKLPDVKKKEL